MAASSPLKDFLVSHLMPEKCFDYFFVRGLLLHVPCLTFVLNKVVGLWILLDIFLAQLLQLLRVLWRGSTEGLSLTSVLLQLYAVSCPVVFAIGHNFPLFAWGERLFVLVQTAMLAFLILHYRGETLLGVLLLSAFSGAVLLVSSCAAAAVVSAMQATSLAALIAGKIFQARTNYYNGHTGELSPLSVLLSWAGSLGLIFVSVQDSGSSLPTMSHVLSGCLSCVLLAQVLSSRGRAPATKDKRE